MKTSGIKSIAAVLFITIVTSLSVVQSQRVDAADCCSQPDHRVKARMVDGTLMPVVDLPAVEIVALRERGIMVKGKIHNGEILIESELPEVEIIGVNPNHQGKPINPDLMADPNLPLVEIQSTITKQKMYSGRIDNDGQPMAITTLPQVEISPDTQSSGGPLAMESPSDELGTSTGAKAKISTFAFRFHPIEWIRLLFQHVSTALLRSTR